MLDFDKILKKIGIKKEKIFLCYFNSVKTDYTPLDIGYILAILKKNKFYKIFDFEIIPFDFINYPKDELSQKILSCESKAICQKKTKAVFFFLDNILWSSVFALGRAKRIAREIKKTNPEIFVGFQSYKFNDENLKEVFLYRKVDAAIGNDPENSFLNLEKILKKDDVLGVVYKAQEISDHQSVCQENLDEIPSPYLSGILDNFLFKKSRQTRGEYISFIYSSRGCRYGCHYCFRSVKHEKVRFFSAKRFYDEIEYLNSHFGIFRFFVLDDAFLFSKERLEEFQAEHKYRASKNSKLKNIRFFINARVESLDEEIVNILKKIGVVRIQIGLQTVNPKLFHYMNRHEKIEKFRDVSRWLRGAGIDLFLDIIINLPGDTLEYLKKTVDYGILLHPTNIQVKQLFLNPGTRFYNERERNGIKTEKIKREFQVPFVISSLSGKEIDYNFDAYNYLIEKINKHPEIKWKLITHLGQYVSKNYHSRF